MVTADRARLAALRFRGARSTSVKTRCGPLHVIDVDGRGPLPPIVLLHGLSSAAADYGGLIKRLRTWSQRIIAPDLPGHGLSAAPPPGTTTHDIIEALGTVLDRVLDRGAPAIVFGNSLGGFVAVRYALRRPDRVSGLFLVSPAGAWCDALALERLLARVRVDDLEKARTFMKTVLPSAKWNLGMLAWGAQVRLSRPAVRQMLEEVRPDDLLTPQELGSLSMPTTLVWGEKERLLPHDDLMFFRRHLPAHANVLTPRSFGHAPYIDQPDEVAALLRRFASHVRAAAPSAFELSEAG